MPKQVKQNGLKRQGAEDLRHGAPGHRALLHARGRRAQPGARDRQDLPQGRQAAAAGEEELGRCRSTPKNLDKYLGVRRFRYGKAEESNRIGHVTGLAWTEVGGELLSIEAAVLPGKGKPVFTGQLGDVMKESIQAAMTVVRSRSDVLGLDKDFYANNDFHIHLPEGATPKDGPSAGIGICTALVSALTKIPVRSDVAMTGEITLRGEVLPIGGLKEKLLAAHRGGITQVLIPVDNEKDLVEIPDNIKGKLDIRPGQVDRRGAAVGADAGSRRRTSQPAGRRPGRSLPTSAEARGAGAHQSRCRRTKDPLDYAPSRGRGPAGVVAVAVRRVLSSAGRASPLQGECRGFDPLSTHQPFACQRSGSSAG